MIMEQNFGLPVDNFEAVGELNNLNKKIVLSKQVD